MTDQDMQSKAPARRLRIALYVSLAVNLLFLGIIGGAILHGPPERGDMMGRELGFGPFTEALSPGDRRALFEAFRSSGASPREMRQAMKADFAQFVQVLRTVPFDAAALEQAAASLRDRGEQRMQLGQRLVTERIAQMSPAQRAAFADRLEQVLQRGPRRGNSGGKGD